MHFRRVVVERPVCTTRAQLRVACFCFEDFGSTAEEDGEAPGSARKPPNNKRRQSQLLQNSFSLTYFQLKLPRPGEVRARPAGDGVLVPWPMLRPLGPSWATCACSPLCIMPA